MRIAHAASALVTAALLAPPAAAQTPWSVSGALEDVDSADDDEHRFDDHAIRLEAGQRYRIAVNSEDFDAMARLYRAGEDEPVAEDDDSGDSLNPRISYAPQASGDYVLRVSGFAADARGAYTAEAAPLPPLPEPSTFFHRMEATIWRVYAGTLEAGDAEIDGTRFDDYRIGFAAGQTRTIWLEAEDFDTIVQLYPLDRREGDPLASDDDSGGGLNSMLTFTPEEAGDYIVRVTSYGEEDSGPYRLKVSE